MRPIPKKLRDELNGDPYYSRCCLNDEDCSGRIEWHHAINYRTQLNERWAIVPTCYNHHYGGKEYLERLELVALERATIEQLQAISKAVNYIQRRDYLRY
jgi:hypothetical protein